MIAKLKKLFETFQLAAPEEQQHTIELATACLMIELARADLNVEAEELSRVVAIMKAMFNISADDVDSIVNEAQHRTDNATSTYEFTSIIAQNFDAEQRIKVIEALWKVAYADGHLDKYEEHFIRKVNDLLYVSHSDFIQAKLRAQTAI
jgi:uncharacterized tellurite resistance protein B-like protein